VPSVHYIACAPQTLVDNAKERNMQNQAEYFVGWGTLSLINAGLAQSKGRSGLIWWLLSLLLGPIATFLIVVFEPVRPPKADSA
jgi:hypothetical protein